MPRSDMNRTKTAGLNTFFLTNMRGPQYRNVNQGTWERPERLVRAWARASGWVHVLTGTVFDRDDNRQPDPVAQTQWSKTGSQVGVPSHLYKIIIRQRGDGTLEAITVLVANRSPGVPGRNSSDATRNTYLRGHINSAHEVRERVGLDLLPTMPAWQRQQLEQTVASGLWPTN